LLSRRLAPAAAAAAAAAADDGETDHDDRSSSVFWEILDTTTLGRGSVWHMVENEWLKKWRKFVLGRGARRYRPPGTINNFSLMQHEVKKDVVGKDGIRRDVRVWKARKEMAVPGEFEEVTERGADGTVNKYTKVKMEPIHLQKHYRAVRFRAPRLCLAQRAARLVAARSSADRSRSSPGRRRRASERCARRMRQGARATMRRLCHGVSFQGRRSLLLGIGAGDWCEETCRGAGLANEPPTRAPPSRAHSSPAHATAMPSRFVSMARPGLGRSIGSPLARVVRTNAIAARARRADERSRTTDGDESACLGRWVGGSMWWVDHHHEVNFNLWHYWKMVHGGGPCISRKNKEIDSPMRCGYMEAVFRMQCFGRMVIAKQKRDDLYWKNLSRNAKEVRRVLAQAQLEKIEADAKASILEAQEKRQDNKLSDACQFTQRVWRSKKTYERFFSLFFFLSRTCGGGRGSRRTGRYF